VKTTIEGAKRLCPVSNRLSDLGGSGAVQLQFWLNKPFRLTTLFLFGPKRRLVRHTAR